MAECKDCIHFCVCSPYTAPNESYPEVDGCKCFRATADVVPKSEEGAECPTCHGTGRIGTTDWLTKGLSKKQLAEEKAKAISEHEQHIKTEVARAIFAKVRKACYEVGSEINNQLMKAIREDDHYQIELLSGVESAIHAMRRIFAEYEKEYTEGGGENGT